MAVGNDGYDIFHSNTHAFSQSDGDNLLWHQQTPTASHASLKAIVMIVVPPEMLAHDRRGGCLRQYQELSLRWQSGPSRPKPTEKYGSCAIDAIISIFGSTLPSISHLTTLMPIGNELDLNDPVMLLNQFLNEMGSDGLKNVQVEYWQTTLDHLFNRYEDRPSEKWLYEGNIHDEEKQWTQKGLQDMLFTFLRAKSRQAFTNQTGTLNGTVLPIVYDYRDAHEDWQRFVGTDGAVSFILMMHLLEAAASQDVNVYTSIHGLMAALAAVYRPKEADAGILDSHNSVGLLLSKINSLMTSLRQSDSSQWAGSISCYLPIVMGDVLQYEAKLRHPRTQGRVATFPVKSLMMIETEAEDIVNLYKCIQHYRTRVMWILTFLQKRNTLAPLPQQEPVLLPRRRVTPAQRRRSSSEPLARQSPPNGGLRSGIRDRRPKEVIEGEAAIENARIQFALAYIPMTFDQCTQMMNNSARIKAGICQAEWTDIMNPDAPKSTNTLLRQVTELTPEIIHEINEVQTAVDTLLVGTQVFMSIKNSQVIDLKPVLETVPQQTFGTIYSAFADYEQTAQGYVAGMLVAHVGEVADDGLCFAKPEREQVDINDDHVWDATLMGVLCVAKNPTLTRIIGMQRQQYPLRNNGKAYDVIITSPMPGRSQDTVANMALAVVSENLNVKNVCEVKKIPAEISHILKETGWVDARKDYNLQRILDGDYSELEELDDVSSIWLTLSVKQQGGVMRSYVSMSRKLWQTEIADFELYADLKKKEQKEQKEKKDKKEKREKKEREKQQQQQQQQLTNQKKEREKQQKEQQQKKEAEEIKRKMITKKEQGRGTRHDRDDRHLFTSSSRHNTDSRADYRADSDDHDDNQSSPNSTVQNLERQLKIARKNQLQQGRAGPKNAKRSLNKDRDSSSSSSSDSGSDSSSSDSDSDSSSSSSDSDSDSEDARRRLGLLEQVAHNAAVKAAYKDGVQEAEFSHKVAEEKKVEDEKKRKKKAKKQKEKEKKKKKKKEKKEKKKKKKEKKEEEEKKKKAKHR